MNADTIIAICSVVIAVAVVAVTIWQSWVMRKHNRLSVKPHLNFEIKCLDAGQPRFSIILRNIGLGPAIIKNFSLLVDNKQVCNPNNKERINIFKNLQINVPYHTFRNIENGSGIGPNDVKTIISLNTEESSTTLVLKMERIDIHIEYESIYKESFRIELNSHLQ